MNTEMIPVADIERMATAVAKSKLFGAQTPEQAMALMLIAQAEGRHPAIAARDYHIIQGRPALKADAILARFQESGGRVEWHKYAADAVEATFSHPQGGSLRIGWTMADAKAAGLGAKDVWKQYPRAMLRARVISEAVRTIYPAVLCGFYTPEEVGDFDQKRGAVTIRDMGPAQVITETVTTPTETQAAPAPTAPDPAVQELRAQLGALRDTLGWTNEELLEWIAGQGYTAAQPAHHIGSLTDMVMKLTATADAKAKREAGDGLVLEGEVVPAGDDSDAEPF